jgi:glycosyltransferase involved in cell wall biosynthesis
VSAANATQVYQLAEALDVGDGVTAIVRRTAWLLATLGEPPDILSRQMWVPESLLPETRPCHDLLATPAPGLLFHYWGYNSSTWALHAMPGRKAVWYHNITPPRFFASDGPLHGLTTRGYTQLGEIANRFDLIVADSRFNLAGFARYLRRPRPALHIYPVVDPVEERGAPADEALLARLRSTPGTNVLFVGRLVRNKRQDDVMRAFDEYRRRFDPEAKLSLVGNEADPDYRRELETLRRSLASADAINLTGKVSDAVVRSHLRAADVLVCASEHEGFCIPLAQAMALDIPVIARAAAAAPETLGGGGFLVEGWEPVRVAELIHRVRSDVAMCAQVLARRCGARARFTLDEARLRVEAVVDYLRRGTWSPLFEWLQPPVWPAGADARR